MARCAHCGKNNRDGSIYCQDCGRKLDAAPIPAPTPAVAKPPTGQQPTLACAQCGTVNPAGMNFCKMCGAGLVARTPAAVAAVPSGPVVKPPTGQQPEVGGAPAKVTCPSCGKQTPAGFAFCQHCGVRLAATPAPAASAPQVLPTPAAGMRPPMAFAPTVAPPTPAAVDALRPRQAPVPAAMAATVPANGPSAARALEPAPAPVPIAPLPPIAPIPIARPTLGKLVVLRRDGSDGDSIAIDSETFDIGRLEGALTFKEDPYLALRHARIVFEGGRAKLVSLDKVNGIYLRIVGSVELTPGDQILLGKELLRFELCAPEEREPPSLVEHGVRLLGSYAREAWGRLRQLTIAGTTRDVWHLTRPEFILGREEGDITFPDDEFMSRQHAAVRRAGTAKPTLTDLESSNGTFLRLRSEHTLRSRDVLRLGDQLLRFES